MTGTVLAFFGRTEILVTMLVVLLLFGGAKLPGLARSLAQALRGFKEELHGVKKDVDDAVEGGGGDGDDEGTKTPDC